MTEEEKDFHAECDRIEQKLDDVHTILKKVGDGLSLLRIFGKFDDDRIADELKSIRTAIAIIEGEDE